MHNKTTPLTHGTETEKMLRDLEPHAYLNRRDAGALVIQALKDYGRRSKIAKHMEEVAYDMMIANGCPNRVRKVVEDLVAFYAHRRVRS